MSEFDSSSEKKRRGRPPKIDTMQSKIQARVSEKTAEICSLLGGSSFIRNLLDKAVAVYEKLDEDRKKDPEAMAMVFQRVAEDEVKIPYVEATVSCGYPDMAFDGRTEPFSFSDYLCCSSHDTYVVEARGDSMVDAGVYEGDMLVLDRSVRPRNGDIVLALLNGDMTLKRIRFDRSGRPELHPENHLAEYPVIKPAKSDEFSVQGVLTGVVRRI